MKIVIDNREHSLIKLMTAMNTNENFNIDIEVKTLDLGDISICSNEGEELLLIERKCVSDLASSIKDGRYKEQSFRLNGYPLHNHNIIYLIEGSIPHYNAKYTKIKPSTLYVTSFCLQYFKGFSLVMTKNLLETTEYIMRMVDKLRRTKDKYGYYHDKFVETKKTYSDVVHKVKKKNITPDNIGNIILSQIPGVSSNTSNAILKKFGSLYQLLKALDDDKSCMNGIKYETKTGSSRSISKTSINNIIQYLLYQKSNVIKIDTQTVGEV
jgi:ERCC4-type nuclease